MADVELVRETWPAFVALHELLTDLPDKVTVPVAPAVSSSAELSDTEIDRIHQGLLRKQRGGSLGLNK